MTRRNVCVSSEGIFCLVLVFSFRFSTERKKDGRVGQRGVGDIFLSTIYIHFFFSGACLGMRSWDEQERKLNEFSMHVSFILFTLMGD